LLIRTPNSLRAQQPKNDETALGNQSHHLSDLNMASPARNACSKKLRYKRRYPNILKEGIGPPTTQSSDLRLQILGDICGQGVLMRWCKVPESLDLQSR